MDRYNILRSNSQTDQEHFSDVETRRQRNRISANKCRENKKKQIQDFKQKNQELEEVNNKLYKQTGELKKQATIYMRLIKAHCEKGCKIPVDLLEMWDKETGNISPEGSSDENIDEVNDQSFTHSHCSPQTSGTSQHLQYVSPSSARGHSEAPMSLFSGTPLAVPSAKIKYKSDSNTLSTSPSSSSSSSSSSKSSSSLVSSNHTYTVQMHSQTTNSVDWNGYSGWLASANVPKDVAPISITGGKAQNDKTSIVSCGTSYIPLKTSPGCDKMESIPGSAQPLPATTHTQHSGQSTCIGHRVVACHPTYGFLKDEMEVAGSAVINQNISTNERTQTAFKKPTIATVISQEQVICKKPIVVDNVYITSATDRQESFISDKEGSQHAPHGQQRSKLSTNENSTAGGSSCGFTAYTVFSPTSQLGVKFAPQNTSSNTNSEYGTSPTSGVQHVPQNTSSNTNSRQGTSGVPHVPQRTRTIANLIQERLSILNQSPPQHSPQETSTDTREIIASKVRISNIAGTSSSATLYSPSSGTAGWQPLLEKTDSNIRNGNSHQTITTSNSSMQKELQLTSTRDNTDHWFFDEPTIRSAIDNSISSYLCQGTVNNR